MTHGFVSSYSWAWSATLLESNTCFRRVIYRDAPIWSRRSGVLVKHLQSQHVGAGWLAVRASVPRLDIVRLGRSHGTSVTIHVGPAISHARHHRPHLAVTGSDGVGGARLVQVGVGAGGSRGCRAISASTRGEAKIRWGSRTWTGRSGRWC